MHVAVGCLNLLADCSGRGIRLVEYVWHSGSFAS